MKEKEDMLKVQFTQMTEKLFPVPLSDFLSVQRMIIRNVLSS